jgi:hypothetical protein
MSFASPTRFTARPEIQGTFVATTHLIAAAGWESSSGAAAMQGYVAGR